MGGVLEEFNICFASGGKGVPGLFLVLEVIFLLCIG